MDWSWRWFVDDGTVDDAASESRVEDFGPREAKVNRGGWEGWKVDVIGDGSLRRVGKKKGVGDTTDGLEEQRSSWGVADSRFDTRDSELVDVGEEEGDPGEVGEHHSDS